MDVSCFDLDLFESEVDSFWFLSTFVGIVNSFSYIHYGKHYAIWGRVLVIFNFYFGSFVDCSLVFLAFSSTNPKIFVHFFPFTFKTTLQPLKVLLIIFCTTHFSGRELENLGKHMVDCIIWMSYEWNFVVFQTYEWEWFTFSKGEVPLVYLALLNSTWWHDVLCNSLGVTKLDI